MTAPIPRDMPDLPAVPGMPTLLPSSPSPPRRWWLPYAAWPPPTAYRLLVALMRPER